MSFRRLQSSADIGAQLVDLDNSQVPDTVIDTQADVGTPQFGTFGIGGPTLDVSVVIDHDHDDDDDDDDVVDADRDEVRQLLEDYLVYVSAQQAVITPNKFNTSLIEAMDNFVVEVGILVSTLGSGPVPDISHIVERFGDIKAAGNFMENPTKKQRLNTE